MDPQLKAELDEAYEFVFVAADAVHAALGRGLDPKFYTKCLARELELNGAHVQSAVAVPVLYRDLNVPDALVLPLVVNGVAVVTAYSEAGLTPEHDIRAQAQLRVSGLPMAVVLNFSAPSIRGGMRRIMNPAPRI